MLKELNSDAEVTVELDSDVEVTVELGEAEELPRSDNVEVTPALTVGLVYTLDSETVVADADGEGETEGDFETVPPVPPPLLGLPA
jgi:hypothetical protein